MSSGYIYLITNKVNGKKYVGKTMQSCAKRFTQHRSDARRGRKRSLAIAIEKYGADQFIFQEIANVPLGFLDYLERMYILLYRTYQRPYGYNRTLGGDGCPATDDVRNKMSAVKKGKPQPLQLAQSMERRRVTPEQRAERDAAKVASRDRLLLVRSEQMTGDKNPFYGKTHSADTKRRLSEAGQGRVAWNKGISPSATTRAKIAETLKGNIPSNKGTFHTEETKAIMKAKRALQVFSPETRAKFSAAHTGVVFTDERRSRISGALKGRTRSEEQKQACRDAVKALWADPVYRDRMLTSRREKAEVRREEKLLKAT